MTLVCRHPSRLLRVQPQDFVLRRSRDGCVYDTAEKSPALLDDRLRIVPAHELDRHSEVVSEADAEGAFLADLS